MKYTFDFDAAIKSGATPEQIDEYLRKQRSAGREYANAPLPASPQDVKFEQENKGDWSDWLPTAGAIAGSFIPGLGPIIGGAAGAGLGAVAKQFVDKKEGFDVGEVAKETALGAAGGIAGKVVSSVAGKVLPRIGEKVAETGENLMLKELRPSKTQLANFAKQHGEDMTQVIKRYNIGGKTATQIEDEAIRPLQDSFNKVVDSSKLRIDPTNMDKKFYDKVSTLLSSPASEDHKLAEKLLEEYGTIMDAIGNKPITGQTINKFRQTFDNKVKSWISDPMEAGKNRVVGSALREILQEGADKAGLTAGDKTLKQAGIELSKLYNIRDLAELQGNLGRGNMPVGLADLLGFGGGGIIGSAAGGPAGFASATAMAAGIKLLNSPKAITTYSKLLSRIGGRLQEGVSPSLGGQIAARTAEQTGIRLPSIASDISQNSNNNGSSQTQQGANNNLHMPSNISQTMGQSQGLPANPVDVKFEQSQGLGATPEEAFARERAKQDTLTGRTPQELFQALQRAQVAGDKVSAAMLEDWFNKEVSYQKTKGTGQKKTEKQAQFQAAAEGANYALQLLQSGKVTTGPISGRVKSFVGSTTGAISPEDQDYRSTIALARSSLLNAFLGGNIPPAEYARISDAIPTDADPPNVAQQKLTSFIREMMRFSNNTNVSTGELPASPQDVVFPQ